MNDKSEVYYRETGIVVFYQDWVYTIKLDNHGWCVKAETVYSLSVGSHGVYMSDPFLN